MSPAITHVTLAANEASEHRPLIITLFALFVLATLGITVWAGQADQGRRRLLRGRTAVQRLPERTRRLRRLHVRRVLPRHRRRDRPLRLRRLPLLHRLPGRLARRSAARRRAAAQLRPLHDGRRPRLPHAPAPGPHRGRHLHDRRVDLLPAGPDGGRGRARLPAARHHLRRREGPHRRPGRRPDDRVRLHRRHEGHHLGADGQGRAAHRRHDPHHLPGAAEVQLQHLRPAGQGRREQRQGRRLPGARPPVRRRQPHQAGLPLPGHRPGARHRRPAAHPDPLLHGAERQGRP